MAEETISMSGLSCQHCVGRVKQALDGINGVTEAKVELTTAIVTFDEAATSRADIEGAIVQAGYKVEG